MARWQLNLAVLWLGQFLVMGGMTMVIPFLPLYIQEMGITDPHEVSIWAGIIFAGNFVTSFIFQPFWGGLADRYGRKMMLLRSSFGMAVITALMGLTANPWQLLLLRMANGMVAGYMPAAVSLISANTPREKIGFAMGMLQSGQIAGSILGPFFGGLMAEWTGFSPIFYLTGFLLFLASLLNLFVIKENFNAKAAAAKPKVSIMASFRQLTQIPQLPALFSVTILFQFAMLNSMPIIPLFIQELHGKTEMLAFLAGLVSSVTGFSNIFASPLLGRLGDRIGAERILIVCLVGSAIAFIPQALVQNVWQLLAARFFLGIFMGGLAPSINALIRKFTPDGMESRAYAFNTSALSLGNMLGPITGGILSGWITIRGVFLFSAVLLFINAFWVRRAVLGNTIEKAKEGV